MTNGGALEVTVSATRGVDAVVATKDEAGRRRWWL
jgi:hypothetical protein